MEMNRGIIILVAGILSFSCTEDTVFTVRSFDGVDIEYEVRGTRDPTLVFVHGWSCDRSYWSGQIDHYAKRFQVVNIDLAGHGGSTTNRETWSMPAYGQDIKAVLDQVGADQIILVGHSAGAYAALAGASILEDKVLGVIGVDGFRFASEKILERRFSDERLKEMEKDYPEDITESMYDMARRMFVPESDTAVVEWVAKDMSQAPREVVVPAALAFYKYRNGEIQADLRKIGSKVPIIEIHAGDRSTVNVPHVREYAPLFDAVYQYGVGHFLMLERSEEFNQILDEQLERIIN